MGTDQSEIVSWNARQLDDIVPRNHKLHKFSICSPHMIPLRYRTTVGVWRGSLLSPTRFNIFLESILTDALEDHEGTVSNGCSTIASLLFAGNIDGLAGDEEELAKLVELLDKASTAYCMEICAEKTKLMTNNANGNITEIKVKWIKARNSHKLQVRGLSYNWWGF